MQLRHRVVLAVRRALDEQGFLEIETPILAKSTPEGARDYLVPSRVHAGEFFALPQSPQIFKQILMISGMDRYFQIARCFRDEDLRADRQPEFTQIDMEVSFATPDVVFGIVERLMESVCAAAGLTVEAPFPRLTYADAMARYGSDKPDLRIGMEIADVSAVFADSSFRVFRECVAEGGVIRALVVPGAGRYSRSQVDKLVDEAIALGASGLVWARRGPEGDVQSSILKVAGAETLGRLLEAADAGDADLVLVAAGAGEEPSRLLGQMRLQLARREGLVGRVPHRSGVESSTSRCSSGTRRRGATCRGTIRSRRPTTTTATSSTAGISAPSGPRPTTSCSTVGRSVAAASGSTSRRCSVASSSC